MGSIDWDIINLEVILNSTENTKREGDTYQTLFYLCYQLLLDLDSSRLGPTKEKKKKRKKKKHFTHTNLILPITSKVYQYSFNFNTMQVPIFIKSYIIQIQFTKR
uniref:Uncharacterized protein n=1 Tax=Cacopsylla melanoneura TaxID=428564 RepID=A0A8D8YVS1_9HEMI